MGDIFGLLNVHVELFVSVGEILTNDTAVTKPLASYIYAWQSSQRVKQYQMTAGSYVTLIGATHVTIYCTPVVRQAAMVVA